MTLKSGWEINCLGEATFESPVQCLSFVNDREEILLDAHVNVIPQPSSTNVLASPALGPSMATLEKAGARAKLFFKPTEIVAGIVTCGGLCPGINNVIRAIVNCCIFRYGVKKVLGFRYGFEGLVPELSSICDLTTERVKDIHQFGGSILGSSRGPQDIGKMVDYLVSLNVSVLFTIGGDGTQRGAKAIADEIEKRGLKIAIIGVPKTVDNDIAFVERTFGFETAVEKAQASIIAAHEEARSAKNGISIVKLMGRESGFIALNAALASGDVNLLLLPEMTFDMDCIVQRRPRTLRTTWRPWKRYIWKPRVPRYCYFLEERIGEAIKELKVEHTIKLIDPSYSIRSAVAVASDAVFALQLGQMAVHAAMAGKTNMIVGVIHNEFVHLPISRAVQFRKKVDIKGRSFQAFLDASGMPLDLCVKDPKAVLKEEGVERLPSPEIKVDEVYLHIRGCEGFLMYKKK
ncbi:phosphofructokinase domain-containing protein [Chytridium lagenaria]|nr:phosphofructokinase domain-containing protein [Chytridium lagenaria]